MAGTATLACYPTSLGFWYWFFAGPAILLALASLRGERRRAAYIHRRLSETSDSQPFASVIVPVKGQDHGLRENLAALATQDYPAYELIVVAHSAADIPPGVLPAHVRVVLAHGDDPATGEKVQNLRVAVAAASKMTEVYVFADSDGRVTKRWLRSLVAPLVEEGVGASTGYRWYFAPLLRSVWDAVALGRLGPGDCGFAWGGAMAIRRQVFQRIDILARWTKTVSDDYALSAGVRAAGLTIAFAPGAMVPCLEPVGLRAMFVWMRRQMTITRVYNSRLWWPAMIAHFFYCVGMAVSLGTAMRGHGMAIWALAAQLAPGMWKGWNRASGASAALPEYRAWFRRFLWVHAAFVPLGTWLWMSVLLASAFGNTIVWRGYRYNLSPSR